MTEVRTVERVDSADDAVVKASKGGFALLLLGLLVAIFALVRDDTHHRASQARAEQKSAAAERQRTVDNARFLESQARVLADFDTLTAQLRAAGIAPKVTAAQVQADAQIRTPPTAPPRRPGASTTTTSTTRPRSTTTTTQGRPPGSTTTTTRPGACLTSPGITPSTLGVCLG